MAADSSASTPGTSRPGRALLERLYAATTALSDALEDELALVQRIAVELAALLDARYAAVGILGEDGDLLVFETTGLTPEEEATLRPQPPHGRGILGALLREGQPLRLEDLTRDPRSVGFPPGHPPMRTFLVVPLLVGGQVLGRLYATERRNGAPFTDEDEILALGFAPAAAVALQSARQTARLVRAERLRATGELAVGVAHDFNNLLATILGRTEVLLGQVRDSEQRESLAAIRRAARDGAATVARMREYGRPVDASAFRSVDLRALAQEVVELTRPRWQDEAQREGRTITARIDLQGEAGPADPVSPVQGDPAALREHGVLLVLAKPAELPALRGALARALRPPAAEAPLDILLVDDATAFATVLGVLLGQGGHRVRRVERAGAAVEVLAGDAPVDLVILDLNLPDGPSVAVQRAARARPRAPTVCVVSGSDPGAMETEVPGADLYVEKAYVPERLERIYAAASARRAGPA